MADKGIKGIPAARHEVSEEITILFTPYDDLLADAQEMPEPYRDMAVESVKTAFAEAMKERYIEEFQGLLKAAKG